MLCYYYFILIILQCSIIFQLIFYPIYSTSYVLLRYNLRYFVIIISFDLFCLVTTYLLYLNTNNLYGWTMMQYLPTGGFRWVRDEYSLNKLKNQINNGLIADNADEKYILRVKLWYPENLHAFHTDYPLAIERMKVKRNGLALNSKS